MHEVFALNKDPLPLRPPQSILTVFGWCFIGPTSFDHDQNKNDPNGYHFHSLNPNSDNVLDSVVCHYLLEDSFGVNPAAKPPVDPDYERALRVRKETVKKVGSRYEAGLSWEEPTLTNNREAENRRFSACKRRLTSDPALKSLYAKVISELVVLRHAHKLTREEAQQDYSGKPGICHIIRFLIRINQVNVEWSSIVLSPSVECL